MNKKEYNPNEEAVEEINTDYEHYQEEQEFEKDSKSNDEIMREKVNGIIEEINEVDRKEIRKKTIKTILLIIAIIIEIIVIILILNNRKKENTNNYKMTLVCTNNNSQISSDYTIKMETTYYFDQNDKVAKTSSAAIYAFNDLNSYNKFIEENKIEELNFKGVERKTAKDEIKHIYKAVTIYDYDLLKKNKKVTFKNNIFTFKLPGDTEETTLMIQGYDDVLETNKILDFTCE